MESTGLWDGFTDVGLEFNAIGRLLKLSGVAAAAFGLWRGITLVLSTIGAAGTLFVTFTCVFLDSDSNSGISRSSSVGVGDFCSTEYFFIN